MTWERKTESMHFKLTRTDREAAEICALLTGQSLSKLIVKALVFYIKKNHPLAYKHGTVMELANGEK